MGMRHQSWKSLLASVAALAAASPAAAVFGSNLVLCGDAETGVLNELPSEWTASGPHASDFYVADAYFGENVQTFHGKVLELYSTLPNREATLSQTIDVSSLQSQISTGRVALSFSAQGFSWYGASASYTVQELNASGAVLNTHMTGVFGLPRQAENYHTTDSSACTWTTSTLTATSLNTATVKLKVSIYAKTSNNNEDYADFDNIELVLTAPPTVATAAVATYGRNSATLGGNATPDNGAAVTGRGVVYSSTNATPSIGGTGVTANDNGSGTGTFGESIGSLAAGTTYYVRAYATNSVGTAYGSVVSFTTAAPPSIGAVAAPGAATYAAGQNLDYTVSFGEAMYVVTTGGTPYLTLTVGGSTVHATYQSGSGTSALVFRYTAASGDLDVDGVALASNVTLDGGTIKDAAGNNATLTFTGGTAATVLVDAVAPTISGGVTVPVANTYGVGANLDYTVNFSENVVVTTTGGTPYLTLTVGGSTVHAAYLSGTTTSAIKFRHTVASGDLDADGVALASNVTLNGGTIKDAAGNEATLTFTGGTAASVLVEGRSSQSITFGALAPQTYGTAALKLTGSSTSGLAISYASSNPAVVRISNDTAYLLKADTTTITASQTGNDAYQAAISVAQKLTIDKKTVSVTADAKTKVYGVADPTLTYTFSGLVGGDAFSGSLGRAAGEDAGSHAITQGNLSAGSNYTLSFTGANLAISKKPLLITGATASNKVYDGTVSATVTGAALLGVVNSDDVSLVLGTASFASKDTGTAKTVTVIGSSLTGAKAGNYDLIEVPGLSATISAKTVSVTADAKSKVYGAADPALTYTSSGLLPGDAITGSLARTPGEAAGSYTIGQGTLTAGNNYTISFTGADLVIQATTALASRPTRAPLSGELDAGVAKAFSSVADIPGPGRMETAACREGVSCLAVDVLLTGSGKVDVAIFDNLGVPVMAFEKVVSRSDLRRLASTGDGRWSLPVSWNLRTSRGDAVPSGVYLWRISVRTDDGRKLDIVRRLGVRNR